MRVKIFIEIEQNDVETNLEELSKFVDRLREINVVCLIHISGDVEA